MSPFGTSRRFAATLDAGRSRTETDIGLDFRSTRPSNRAVGRRALISAGYLVGTTYYAPTEPNLRGVRTQAGDYVLSELAERVDRPDMVADVISTWHRYGERRKTWSSVTNPAGRRTSSRRSSATGHRATNRGRGPLARGEKLGALPQHCLGQGSGEGGVSPSRPAAASRRADH
jgi:hypothetical protein